MAGRDFGALANDAGANDDDVDDSLWQSPVKPAQQHGKAPSTSNAKPTQAEQQARDESLRQELANVRKVNETIEGVIENLNKAKTNMKTVNQTVGAASSLLNTWTRILSQTEHSQRLILDPTWQGASQDVADIEAETVAKQYANQRKEAEEQQRRSQAAVRAEEEERRRLAEGTKQQKTSLRVRGRVTSRGASTAPSGYFGADTPANTSASGSGRGSGTTRRPASGIGRGRARGRG